jgi:hypothetical protein
MILLAPELEIKAPRRRYPMKSFLSIVMVLVLAGAAIAGGQGPVTPVTIRAGRVVDGRGGVLTNVTVRVIGS